MPAAFNITHNAMDFSATQRTDKVCIIYH